MNLSTMIGDLIRVEWRVFVVFGSVNTVSIVVDDIEPEGANASAKLAPKYSSPPSFACLSDSNPLVEIACRGPLVRIGK